MNIVAPMIRGRSRTAGGAALALDGPHDVPIAWISGRDEDGLATCCGARHAAGHFVVSRARAPSDPAGGMGAVRARDPPPGAVASCAGIGRRPDKSECTIRFPRAPHGAAEVQAGGSGDARRRRNGGGQNGP